MFVFRGERLKEEGYIASQRKVFNEELEWTVKYYLEKMAEARKKEEDLVMDRSGEMEAYKIFTKPFSELTNKEKERLILQYEAMQQIFGGKKPPRRTYSDEEVEAIRTMLKPMNNPLENIRQDMEFYNRMIKEARDAHKNNMTIALNRNAINRENIDAIIKHVKKAKEKGLPVRVFVDNATGRKNNEDVDYVFTKEDMNLLIELDTFLKSNGYLGLSISEFKEVGDLDDAKNCWTLNQVIDANNKIDIVAKYIKDHNLSPFEAITYIHKWASNFVYNGGMGLQDGRVLPSTLNTDKIVCSGYASMVKAVVDRANLPGLSCEIKGCYIIIDGKPNGHCHNLVTINDPKYGIDGTYVEDACWDSKLKGEDVQRGVAHCLYSVNDLMCFNGGSRYFSLDREDRFSNLLVDTKDLEENLKMTRAGWLRKLIWKMQRDAKYKTTIPEVVKKYGENSEPIPIEKYEEALRVVYGTKYDDPNIIEEKVRRDVENSKARAVSTFNERSSNVFSRGLSKTERKKVTTASKGPQTRL